MKDLKQVLLKKEALIKLKNFSLLFISFILLFALSSYSFFMDFKNDLIEKSKKDYQVSVDYLNLQLKEYILSHDMQKIDELMSRMIKTNKFKSIKLNFDRLLFTSEALLINTPSFSDSSFLISDVAIDAKYGQIVKLQNSFYYELVSSSNLDKNEFINIRYQAYKDDEIKTLFARLNFNIDEKIEKISEDRISFPSWLDFFYTQSKQNIQKDILLGNIRLASINYELDTYLVSYEVYTFIKKLFFYAMFMFFPILLVINYYNKFIFRKYVTTPLHKLNEILEGVENNNFRKINKKDFEAVEEVNLIISKISSISNKLASYINEINVNKETIHRKMSTDTLTGLENQKIFELDIKAMFVSSIPGYVSIIKIPSLAEFSKLNGSSYTDTFIENFVSILKNTIFNFTKTEIKLYRFYGSEFALIAKRYDSKKVEPIVNSIIKNIVSQLASKYNLPNNIINIGGTPFDMYGTLFSIMKSANKAYDLAKKTQNNSAYLISEEEIEHNYATLEKIVSTTIHDANFDVDYASNSYSFDDGKLLMQEVSPLLYDNNRKQIPIGSFVSIAEKINEIVTFDKLVIQKVVEYLKYSKAKHEIAINLAVDTISNKEFNEWLKEFLTQNANLRQNLVFSITSYTASLHKHKFKKFTEQVNEFGAKVLLKRYNTNDYPMEELENVKVNYLRIDRDYTSNVANDKVKKHKVKNILIFAQLNGMEVLTDAVKSDQDYALLERLGIYATSR